MTAVAAARERLWRPRTGPAAGAQPPHLLLPHQKLSEKYSRRSEGAARWHGLGGEGRRGTKTLGTSEAAKRRRRVVAASACRPAGLECPSRSPPGCTYEWRTHHGAEQHQRRQATQATQQPAAAAQREQRRARGALTHQRQGQPAQARSLAGQAYQGGGRGSLRERIWEALGMPGHVEAGRMGSFGSASGERQQEAGRGARTLSAAWSSSRRLEVAGVAAGLAAARPQAPGP